jgi:hypothetical protein
MFITMDNNMMQAHSMNAVAGAQGPTALLPKALDFAARNASTTLQKVPVLDCSSTWLSPKMASAFSADCCCARRSSFRLLLSGNF